MDMYYDPRDDQYHERRGSQILYWLDDLGAKPLTEARADSPGFLFAGSRPIEDYRRLVGSFPHLRDRPEERFPLLTLDRVLGELDRAGVSVPAPRTWLLPLDAPIPADIAYPLFVRTAETSLKLGGRISRVRNERELRSEMGELRRAIRWDAVIMAREWLDLAPAGQSAYGPVPQEVRVWVVDGEPYAWSFHHLHIVRRPEGFPLTEEDRGVLRARAAAVGRAFRSRLVAADFARGSDGEWWFIEAGPGSCAGTGHESVFKSVARRLLGCEDSWAEDQFGGLL